jgi:hypothetical protein
MPGMLANICVRNVVGDLLAINLQASSDVDYSL